MFAFVALFLLILFSKRVETGHISATLNNRISALRLQRTSHYFIFTGLGVLLALHWWAFFHSIQISTVAVGLLTFSTFPVFCVFLEPLFFKEKIGYTDIMAALLTFGGIVWMTPKFDLNDSTTIGAVFGVLSGLSFAVLQILNRKYVQMYSGRLITCYQTGVAAFVLLLMVSFTENSFTMSHIFMLMILGVLCTAAAHSLFISGLRSVKVRSASIIAGLEPVYGIVFAMIFLCEMPSCREIVSGIVILCAVAFVSMKKKDVSFKRKW